MISYFTSPDVTLGNKLLEVIYIAMGLICIYCAVRNLRDKANKANIGTCVFWGALGLVMAFGRALTFTGADGATNYVIPGILVFIMTVPAVIRQVKPGKHDVPTREYTKSQSDKIGMKIFVPAFSIGVLAILFALVPPKLGALVGVGVGVVLAIVVLMVLNTQNKPTTFLDDSRRLLDTVGPLSMLPMLLASLGSIFTAAGVGDVVAGYVRNIVPEGNVVAGIIVYAIAMALFTMIMGNAFAAITVITTGIGYPFVIALGASPVLIGMVALTCGYCGTLMTPMAANFNIVPVAMLEMKDRYGVIKNQIYVAIPLLLFQILYMIVFRNILFMP